MLDEHLTNHDIERTCPLCESGNGEVRTAKDGTEGCPFCITRCDQCGKFKDNEHFADGKCLDCQGDLFEIMNTTFKP